jgi:hypothetical protein
MGRLRTLLLSCTMPHCTFPLSPATVVPTDRRTGEAETVKCRSPATPRSLSRPRACRGPRPAWAQLKARAKLEPNPMPPRDGAPPHVGPRRWQLGVGRAPHQGASLAPLLFAFAKLPTSAGRPWLHWLGAPHPHRSHGFGMSGTCALHSCLLGVRRVCNAYHNVSNFSWKWWCCVPCAQRIWQPDVILSTIHYSTRQLEHYCLFLLGNTRFFM